MFGCGGGGVGWRGAGSAAGERIGEESTAGSGGWAAGVDARREDVAEGVKARLRDSAVAGGVMVKRTPAEIPLDWWR